MNVTVLEGTDEAIDNAADCKDGGTDDKTDATNVGWTNGAPGEDIDL